MAQPEFYTMCATVFAPDGSFDESAMRCYLRRQLRGELGAVNRGQMMDEFVQALRTDADRHTGRDRGASARLRRELVSLKSAQFFIRPTPPARFARCNRSPAT
jgi:hypothetical protein